MRTNRVYRIRATGVGKAHLARTNGTGRFPGRAFCGAWLPSDYSSAVEYRGGFGREGDCGRCSRVLPTRGNT
jgi:hypothetical protein